MEVPSMQTLPLAVGRGNTHTITVPRLDVHSMIVIELAASTKP
jgi:hypothetical protein